MINFDKYADAARSLEREAVSLWNLALSIQVKDVLTGETDPWLLQKKVYELEQKCREQAKAMEEELAVLPEEKYTDEVETAYDKHEDLLLGAARMLDAVSTVLGKLDTFNDAINEGEGNGHFYKKHQPLFAGKSIRKRKPLSESISPIRLDRLTY